MLVFCFLFVWSFRLFNSCVVPSFTPPPLRGLSPEKGFVEPIHTVIKQGADEALHWDLLKEDWRNVGGTRVTTLGRGYSPNVGERL